MFWIKDVDSTEISKAIYRIACELIDSEYYEYFDSTLKRKISNNCSFADKITKDILSVFLKSKKALPESLFDSNEDEINTPKGILHLPSLTLRERTIDDLVFNCTNADYIEDYDGIPYEFTEPIRMVIELPNLCDEENNKRLESLMFIYAYFLSGRIMEKILVLETGASSSGKSTRHKILRHIMGSYAGIMESKELVYNPNSKSEIGISYVFNRNKRLVVSSELDSKDTFDGAKLKQLSGSDPFQKRQMRKGKLIDCTKHQKYLISTNEIPLIKMENSDAFYQRLCVVHNLRPIPENMVDENYFEKMISKEQCDKIFSFLVGAFKHYSDNGKLYRHPSFLTDKLSFLLQQDDPVSLFFDCCVQYNNIHNSGQKITIKELFKEFNNFCGHMKLKHSYTMKGFSKRFSEICEPLNIFKRDHDPKHGVYYDQFSLCFNPQKLNSFAKNYRRVLNNNI